MLVLFYYDIIQLAFRKRGFFMDKSNNINYIAQMFFHISQVERLIRETKQKIDGASDEEIVDILNQYSNSIVSFGRDAINIENDNKELPLDFNAVPIIPVSSTSESVAFEEKSNLLLEQMHREKVFRKLIDEYAPKEIDNPVLKKRY